MLSSKFKVQFHQHCINLLQEQIQEIQKGITGQKDGSEGSSSAGDKHNTEQAMQHLELEKKHHQLDVKVQNLNILQQINPENQCDTVALGAYVQTNKGNFYFGGPLGKIKFQDTDTMVLSLASPLGRILSKMKKGESVCFNSDLWVIDAIV